MLGRRRHTVCAETMAGVEDAPPQDAAEGGTSSGGKKGRYRREKPWVRL